MSSGPGQPILVLGGGISGLLATAVVRDLGHDFLLVEPDEVPRWPRRGVPHASQLHNLLGRGQRSLERCVPGSLAALESAGAIRASVATQTHVHELGMTMPERELELAVYSVSRATLEDVLRDLVRLPDSSVVRGRFAGLRISGEGRVTGAQIDIDGHSRGIDASLVVDAMGGNSPMRRWWSRHGPSAPPVQRLALRQWYATARVRVPSGSLASENFWMCFPFGDVSRGGLISPVSANECRASLNGAADDEPPRSVSDFRAYAASLADLGMHWVLQSAVEIGEPVVFQKPVAEWRRFDLLQNLVGFVSVGDASATLNPLFGQGVSGAAWEASQLQSALETAEADSAELTLAYWSRSAQLRSAMWDLMTLFVSGRAAHYTESQWEVLRALIKEDPQAHRTYVEMWHLLAPVAVLDELVAGRVPSWAAPHDTLWS